MFFLNFYKNIRNVFTSIVGVGLDKNTMTAGACDDVHRPECKVNFTEQ